MVNFKLDAQEVERMVVTRSGQSAGQGTTGASATGRPRVPLTVCVGSANNVQSVFRPHVGLQLGLGLKARTM